MKPADNIEKLIKKLRYKAGDEAHNRVLNNVFQALEMRKKQKSAVSQPNIWRIIMKSPITKLTVAAVIIIAVVIGINQFGGRLGSTSVAWADVVKPILNARTATLDILIGSQEHQMVIHDEVMGSRIRRTVLGVKHSDIIIDLEQQKLLTLDHAQKTAAYIELGGLPDLQNYVELLRNMILRLQNKPDFQVDDRGLQVIEGQDYIVFVAESDKDTITIWANPETALPVRIEQKTPNMQIVCNNLQFDVVLDESLFSMEVPDNYVIQKARIDFKESSESGFIESLRIWAEIIEDGQFPDSIDLGGIAKVGLKLDEGLKRLNLTDQEELEVATRFGQGLVFIRFFKGEGQWNYVGKGVKLGDSEKAVFWYQPKDSETYRVIYGDLHVEDVEADKLPE